MMHNISLSDKRLISILDKLSSEERLDFDDGCLLYRSSDLIGKAKLADLVRQQKHGKKAFFVYNQHINYTNVCKNNCLFCAFSREKDQEGAFTLSIEEVERRLNKRLGEPIREIHVVGGVNPSLPFEYYLKLIETIKSIRPEATVKAFTAVEIDYFSEIAGLSVTETILRLKEAGLSMMPGGVRKL